LSSAFSKFLLTALQDYNRRVNVKKKNSGKAKPVLQLNWKPKSNRRSAKAFRELNRIPFGTLKG